MGGLNTSSPYHLGQKFQEVPDGLEAASGLKPIAAAGNIWTCLYLYIYKYVTCNANMYLYKNIWTGIVAGWLLRKCIYLFSILNFFNVFYLIVYKNRQAPKLFRTCHGNLQSLLRRGLKKNLFDYLRLVNLSQKFTPTHSSPNGLPKLCQCAQKPS